MRFVFVEVNPHVLTAMLSASFATSVFDQNPSHRLGGGRKEVAATVPMLGLLDINQSDVRLVNQGRGLEGLAGCPSQKPRPKGTGQAIWEIYLEVFGLDRSQPRPRDEGWTGAEIRACCRLSALLDVPLSGAAQNVVPVSATAAESVERLRTWAAGRCLDADEGGIYRHNGAARARPGRKVRRPDPSNN